MRFACFAVWLCACGPSPVVEHPPPGTLDSIAWMHAAWRARDGERVTDEIWTPTGEHTWMGLSRSTEGGRTVHHELLRMEVREDGVRYVAAPAGQSVTPFALVRASSSEARFENPGHDFPTWIQYAVSRRSLTATIGGNDSDEPAATWRFERTGDAPGLVDVPARLCRDGSTLTVEIPPCQCGGELFCAGFETDEGTDVHVALLDSSCDACTPTTGTCTVPDAPIARVNGRPVTTEGRCALPPVPLLILVDL
ncbi:MAG: hypothetical protein H6719_14780 [Sandaracinaceae bacterium]|nr:hypothetical protein [Sandaracinaceae bacterium]